MSFTVSLNLSSGNVQRHSFRSKGILGTGRGLPNARCSMAQLCPTASKVPSAETKVTNRIMFSYVSSSSTTGAPKVTKIRDEDLRTNSAGSTSAKDAVQYLRENSNNATASRRWNSLPPVAVMKAVVTVMRKPAGIWPQPGEDLLDKMDAIADQLGLANIFLQLVSIEIDPKTGIGKRSNLSKLRDWAEKASVNADKVQYTAEFTLAKDFGTPGAILVYNNHQREFCLESISLKSSWRSSDVYFHCQSWVQPAKINKYRIFFSNQVYLPSETPRGLRDLREIELKALRGDGKGMLEQWERIYDYATYNDLGDPDNSKDLARPALGGSSDLPYPRRCRTGRPPTKADPSLESRTAVGGKIYVPRDENFDPIKASTFIDSCMKGLVHKLAPSVLTTLREAKILQGSQFKNFADIDRLYGSMSTHGRRNIASGGVIPDFGFLGAPNEFVQKLPFIGENSESNFDIYYPTPELISKDRFAWIRDEEFGRQMLAGQNPSTIECLKVFPPVSELDANEYGPQTSAITVDHIKHQLGGLSVEQALEQKKLFILDYHDLFMPFINAVNSLEGRKMYASRTVLFLTKDGTLKPIAIELSLPPGTEERAGSQRVFTPGDEHTSYWLWTIAKSHVCSNDAGYHQLVSHWLRTHAATEPYVIATHRQLSSLHPIAKLLSPHFRYTLEINGAARQNLIAADGVIEQNIDSSNADPITKMMFKIIGTLSLEACFTPGKYCMEMSAAVYKKLWRFDMEALPADLIRRGMAVEDKNAPLGVKLTIDDYPYAADGLLLWSGIETWVTDYVSIFYQDPCTIINDIELQQWWAEIRYVGHADKRNEPWWPKLESQTDLIQILTTMIWITSGHHAAVNFGQFAYAGYVPNRPCLTRRLIPQVDEAEYQDFLRDPQSFFLSTLPNQEQATVMMMIIEALSAHSPDEEYLGQRKPRWTSDGKSLEAFQTFTNTMMAIEREIKERNCNPKNKNRNGAGVVPYQLLFPRSGPGITGRGVPNSVSI